MSFDEDFYWEKMRESMENFSIEETDVKKLMELVDVAIDSIKHVCKKVSCKECLYHDEDGCALKVKEWNA